MENSPQKSESIIIIISSRLAAPIEDLSPDLQVFPFLGLTVLSFDMDISDQYISEYIGFLIINLMIGP